jgi:DNA-binding NarL/FixJ family response regulator
MVSFPARKECLVLLPNHELPTTSVLLIDGHDSDRTSFANQLKRCSPDYTILQAADRRSGLDLYRQSRRIDCVVHEIDLPDSSGFQLLVDLIPVAKRPTVAVIILTRLSNQALWELAKKNGAYVCLFKPHTSGDYLDKVIQRAINWVGLIPKEDPAPARLAAPWS